MSKKSMRSKVKEEVRRMLSEEDLHEAFQYAPAHPLWQAVMAVADSFREGCVLVSTDPELSQKESDMALGGVATMDDWIAELEQRAGLAMAKKEMLAREEARKQVAEEREKTRKKIGHKKAQKAQEEAK